MATARTEGSLRIASMLPEHADQVLAIYQAGSRLASAGHVSRRRDGIRAGRL